MNLYEYVGGLPANRADPAGYDDWNHDCLEQALCCCATTREMVKRMGKMKLKKCQSIIVTYADGQTSDTPTGLLEKENEIWLKGGVNCEAAATTFVHEYAHSRGANEENAFRQAADAVVKCKWCKSHYVTAGFVKQTDPDKLGADYESIKLYLVAASLPGSTYDPKRRIKKSKCKEAQELASFDCSKHQFISP